MAKVRIPFPWEDDANPLDGVECKAPPIAIDAAFGGPEYSESDHRRAIAREAADLVKYAGLTPAQAQARAVRTAVRYEKRRE